MNEQRPNPEKLLKRVQEEERQQHRGKLKIYLGAAPGVGKTHMMLKDALEKRTRGLDVIIGVAESHGRKEIDAMIKNFEILPKQQIDYKARVLTEFDLDAALKRNPGIILIDEMAHTNAPGLRHAKRWQDIKEILDRGIDVYTTLNVQHIESLNDVVSQIIHTRVKETVPDYMVELADTIELVDLPPEDLLKRLKEGKVYYPQQAELAGENFFRKGNLIALRELALRVTAERVGAQVLLYRQGKGIKHIWPTREKILTCVGPGAESIKLIRAARRLSVSLHAEWVAVHVDAPRLHLSEEQRSNAIQYLRLAEQLGAEVRIITGFDIVKEIIEFSHEQNITKIVIGKKQGSRWEKFFSKKLTDEIVNRSAEIDIYIVSGESEDFKRASNPTGIEEKYEIPWKIYGITIAIISIATTIDLIIYPLAHTSNLIMVYMLGVTVVALFGRIGPSIVASVLSVVAYAYFFMPSVIGRPIGALEYFFTLFVMLLVTQVISQLTILSRRQASLARSAEKRTAILHTLSKQLASTRGVDKLLEIAVPYLADIFDSKVLAMLPEKGSLVVRARHKTKITLNEKELSIAKWVYDLKQSAGLGTDTLPFSDAIFLPLLTVKDCVGVLRVEPTKKRKLFTPEQIHLLEACANQIALALKVDRLQDQSKKTEVLSETTRAKNALLQSVSEDLRSPLISVMGYASTLMEMSKQLESKTIKKIGKDIYFETEQLNRLINNLLQITYMEAESVKLQKEYHQLKLMVIELIDHSNAKFGKRIIEVEMSDNLPEIPFDKILIQEVILNLLDNAVKFSPSGTPIKITANVIDNKMLIKVKDNGPGIVPDEIDKLFEKFYRGRLLTSERGLGLGLAICRNVVKAHGGEIWANNLEPSGAEFCFTLPLS